MSTLGTRIRRKREALELSRENLGQRIGVRGQTIYRWEKDEIAPRAPTLAKLARELGVTAEWLTDGDGFSAAAPTQAIVEDPPYPAWEHFLSRDEARTATPAEIDCLRAARWPRGKAPTAQTYLGALAALRAWVVEVEHIATPTHIRRR